MVGRARIKASNHIAIKQRYLLQVVSLTLVKGKTMTMSRSTARTRIVKIDARNATWLIKYPACISVGLSGNQWRSPNRSSPGKPMSKSHTARFKMKKLAAVLQSSLYGSLQITSITVAFKVTVNGQSEETITASRKDTSSKKKRKRWGCCISTKLAFYNNAWEKKDKFQFSATLSTRLTKNLKRPYQRDPWINLTKLLNVSIEQAKQRGPRKIRVVSLYFVIGWLCNRPFKSVVTWLLIGGLNCTVTELIVPLLTLVLWVVKTFYFLNCWVY